MHNTIFPRVETDFCMQAVGHIDPKGRDLKANISATACQMLMACIRLLPVPKLRRHSDRRDIGVVFMHGLGFINARAWAFTAYCQANGNPFG